MATFEGLLKQIEDAKIVNAAARSSATAASMNASLAGDKLEVAQEMVGELMVAPSPPPPASNVVCEFDAAKLHGRFREHVQAGADFRTVDDGGGLRLQSKRNSTHNGIDGSVGKILFPKNYMAPELNSSQTGDASSTNLDTFINSQTPNGHSQIRLGGDKLIQGAWTRPEHVYRWKATFDMPASCDWGNLAWVLPMQAHPGAYGPNWENPHHRPPAIALYMKRHEWEFWVRGSSEGEPTRMMDNWKSDRIPFVPGIQFISIEFRCDPLSQLSFADCVVNGVRLASVQQPVGINHSALGAGKSSLNLAMGYYGISPKNLRIKGRKGRVRIMSSKLSIVG